MIRAALILGLAALVLMAPALIYGAPAIDSAGYTHVWTEQFAAEMARGELYPRWMPRSFEGLGSPTFYFYPPLTFHLTGALALFLETRYAISVAGLLLLFASGMAMYLWLRGKTSWALAASVVYMAAPYHLIDFYVRATLAEFAAFAWLPLIALAIESQGKRWGGPLLALSYAGLVLTHLPVALLTTVLLIPPLVLLSAWKDPKVAVRCAVAGVAGLAISALYLLPALTLQDHTLMSQIMWKAHFDARNWSVLKLFGPGADEMLRPLSFLAVGWGVVGVAAALRGGRFWPAVTLFAVLCSLGLIPLLVLPILDRVQFPWRALTIIEFTAITAVALWRPRPIVLALAAFLLIQGAEPFARAGVKALQLRIPAHHLAMVIDAVEYLPQAYTPAPKGRYPTGLETYRGPLVQGAATDVRAARDGSVSLRATADGRITIRRANFARWQVEGPGGKIPIVDGPLIGFEAKAGEAYRLAAVRTPMEVAGGWISLLGLAFVALWFWRGRRRAA